MLGKPKGTLQKSKFDQHLVGIKELLSYGLSVRKIARVLGYSSYIALNTYLHQQAGAPSGSKDLKPSSTEFSAVWAYNPE